MFLFDLDDYALYHADELGYHRIERMPVSYYKFTSLKSYCSYKYRRQLTERLNVSS